MRAIVWAAATLVGAGFVCLLLGWKTAGVVLFVAGGLLILSTRDKFAQEKRNRRP